MYIVYRSRSFEQKVLLTGIFFLSEHPQVTDFWGRTRGQCNRYLAHGILCKAGPWNFLIECITSKSAMGAFCLPIIALKLKVTLSPNRSKLKKKRVYHLKKTRRKRRKEMMMRISLQSEQKVWSLVKNIPFLPLRITLSVRVKLGYNEKWDEPENYSRIRRCKTMISELL